MKDLKTDPEQGWPLSRFSVCNKKGQTISLHIFAVSNFSLSNKALIVKKEHNSIKFHSNEKIISHSCMAFHLLHNNSLFSPQFSGLLYSFFSGIMKKEKDSLTASVFLRKTENTTAGIPLRNSCEIIHASLDETGKSRFFSLMTGFEATTGMTYSSTMHRYSISMTC